MHPEIDWPGIRAAALALGVREAARQAALAMPLAEKQRFVERVKRRATRQHWLQSAPVPAPSPNMSTSAPVQPENTSPVVPRALTGAEIIARTLATRREKSALHLSKYVVDSARKLARSKGELKHAKAGESVSRIRAQVWPEAGAQAAVEITLTERDKTRELQARVRALLT